MGPDGSMLLVLFFGVSFYVFYRQFFLFTFVLFFLVIRESGYSYNVGLSAITLFVTSFVSAVHYNRIET